MEKEDYIYSTQLLPLITVLSAATIAALLSSSLFSLTFTHFALQIISLFIGNNDKINL